MNEARQNPLCRCQSLRKKRISISVRLWAASGSKVTQKLDCDACRIDSRLLLNSVWRDFRSAERVWLKLRWILNTFHEPRSITPTGTCRSFTCLISSDQPSRDPSCGTSLTYMLSNKLQNLQLIDVPEINFRVHFVTAKWIPSIQPEQLQQKQQNLQKPYQESVFHLMAKKKKRKTKKNIFSSFMHGAAAASASITCQPPVYHNQWKFTSGSM